MATPYEKFKAECEAEITAQGEDKEFVQLSNQWITEAQKRRYSYHFEWMGRPIIQYPQDIMAMQELVWKVKPDLIIETGIAHGGSLVFLASMLELNAQCGGPADAKILGIDIDIRAHNLDAIKAHPMSKRIEMIQGSSIAPEIISQVKSHARGRKTVMVSLDSNHTHAHVLDELNAYAPLTTIGSYCVVFDTVVQDMQDDMFDDRPWGVGDNPKTAVWEYLKSHSEFEIDKSVDGKLMVSVAPSGFLKRVA